MICICIFFLLMRCNTSQPPMNGTWYRPGHSTLCEEPHAAGGVSCKGEMDRWYSHGMGTRRYTNQIMDVHWLQPATEEVFVFFLRTCVTGSWSISTSVSIFQPKHLQSTYDIWKTYRRSGDLALLLGTPTRSSSAQCARTRLWRLVAMSHARVSPQSLYGWMVSCEDLSSGMIDQCTGIEDHLTSLELPWDFICEVQFIYSTVKPNMLRFKV